MNKGSGILKIILTLIGIMLLTLLAVVIINIFGLAENPSVGAYATLLSQAIMAVATYFLIRHKKKTEGESYIKNRGFTDGSWKMFAIGLGTLGFGNILITLLMKLFDGTNLLNMSMEMVGQAFTANDSIAQILLIFTVVIIAPIMEEYLFRGFVFEETNKMFGVGASIVISGLLFGIYHMNLLQTVNAFILGMILAAVYYYRGNITDSIIVHFTNNAMAMITTFFPQYATYFGIVLIIFIFIGAKFLYDIIKGK